MRLLIESSRLKSALNFEDEVIAQLHSYGIFAETFGNRNYSSEMQLIMRKDVQGHLALRTLPDIYAQRNGYSFFVDAKRSHNKNTSKHLVDVNSEQTYVGFEEFIQRPVVLAFWHVNGEIGYQNLSDWIRNRNIRPMATVRGSEAELFYLSPCYCTDLFNALEMTGAA